MLFPNPAGGEGKKGRELGWRLDGKSQRRVEMNSGQCWGRGLAWREPRGTFRNKGKATGQKAGPGLGKDGVGAGLLRGRQTLKVWRSGPSHTPMFLS